MLFSIVFPLIIFSQLRCEKRSATKTRSEKKCKAFFLGDAFSFAQHNLKAL